MSILTDFGAGLIIFLAILIVLAFGTPLLQARRIRWRSGSAMLPSCQDSATDTEQLLVEASTVQLKNLGFEPAFWVQLLEPTRQDNTTLHVSVWFNSQYCTYAQIAPHPMPEKYQQTHIDFLTFYENGLVLDTSNGMKHLFIDGIAQWEVTDHYLPSMTQQWELHRQRLSQHAMQPCPITATDYCDRSNEFLNQFLNTQLQQGAMKPISNGLFGVTLKGAWQMLRRQRAAIPKIRAMTQQMQQTPSAMPNAAADILAHQRHEAMLEGKRTDMRGKLGLLLVSVLVFTMSFGIQFDLRFVAILVGVLLLHELGHLLAMALFGFRDLQILFIPFLGAVAIGRNQHCPAWKRALIDLAGPVPGILVAGLLWHAGAGNDSELWLQVIIFLLLLNYFNLMPIHPLDGGHLMHLLLMQRWPRLQIAFWIASVAAFFLLALWLKSALMAALGFLFGFALRHQIREAQVLQHARAQHGDTLTGDSKSLHALYTSMHELNLPWNFGHRFQAARNVLHQLSIPFPSARESFFGLSLYLVALIGTPALIWMESPHFIRHWIPTAEEKAPDWEQMLADTRTDTDRLEILMEAGEHYHWSEESDKALAYYDQARALISQTSGEESSDMVKLLIKLANTYSGLTAGSDNSDPARAQASLEKALVLLDSLPASSVNIHLRAQSLESLGDLENTRGQIDPAFKHYEKALQIHQESGYDTHSLSRILTKQARIFVSQNNIEKSNPLFERALDELAKTPDEAPYYQWTVLAEFVQTTLNQQRYEDAIAILERYPLATHQHTRYWETEVASMRAWASFKSGQTAVAAQLYENLAVHVQSSKDAGKYALPDNLARLLVVQHVQAGGGEHIHTVPKADAYARLRQSLDSAKITFADYLKHLDCECKREIGGYQLEQSNEMRAAVHHYAGIHEPSTISARFGSQ